MKTYETTIIFNALLEEPALEEEIAKVDKYLAENAGEVLKQERWGSRRMTYEIKKKTHGFYVHWVYSAKPEVSLKLEEGLRINENALRYLTVLQGT